MSFPWRPAAAGVPAPTAHERGMRRIGLLVVLTASLGLGACATITGRQAPGQRLDPWENWNRKVFAFNEGLDERVLKPVATVYSNTVPQPVRQGVANFFNNAADAWSAVNNVLQGKFAAAAHDVMRVGTNTVFGLGGILDPASEIGLEHHYEDLGQTLGFWGAPPGAYIVWPLLGPSTVRESIALPFDRAVSPAVLVNNGSLVTGITVLQIVNTRANLLGASRVVDDIALDKYTFVRDAYLQRRRSLIFDGDVPDTPDTPDAPDVPLPAGGGASGPAAKPADKTSEKPPTK